MSVRDEAWAATISTWAEAQADIKALVQIGSRVKNDGTADEWSDFDYQLITTNPSRYKSGEFARSLGTCWAVGLEHTFGDVVKVTAVFDGALEADFVILRHSDLLFATTALKWPGTAGMWPRPLRVGVNRLRGAAGTGWKVIKGGLAWEKRYARLTPLEFPMTEGQFSALCGEFWVQLVWAAKRAQRGELLASRRTIHRYVIESYIRMVEEQPANGAKASPRGRRAESWMPSETMVRLDAVPNLDARDLIRFLSSLGSEFAKVSAGVALLRGWPKQDDTSVLTWILGLS
jgi:hypothetical protein